MNKKLSDYIWVILLAILLVMPGISKAQPLKAIVESKVAPGYDPDAQAFLTAAAITDLTIGNAINNLVVNAKVHGWWSLCNAIYPMVGGTSTTCKYNLKDPRDVDAAFRLTFYNSPTFSSAGVAFNGTNQYADTHLVPNSVISLNSAHISVYSADTSSSQGASGCGNIDVTTSFFLQRRYFYTGCDWCNNGVFYTALNSLADDGQTVLGSNIQGWLCTSRVSSSQISAYHNGSSPFLSSSTSPTSQPLTSFFIGAVNASNTAGANSPSTYEAVTYRFFTIGSGIDQTTIIPLMYQDIQNFQAALGRAV